MIFPSLLRLSLLLAPLATAVPVVPDVPHVTPPPDPELVQRGLAQRAIPRNTPLDPEDPWVSVDKKGTPTTITPVATLDDDGEETILSGAPNELTGTIFTITDKRLVKVTTSTGDPPLATAKNKNGKGAFPPCYNQDGQDAPFCAPASDNELWGGKTYYVTWDASIPMLKSNVTEKFKIKILADLVNTTTDEYGPEVLNPDPKHHMRVSYGFFPWKVTNGIILDGYDNATVRLRMQRFLDEEVYGDDIIGPTVLVRRQIKPEVHHHGGMPQGAELYIALPSVFGFILLVVFGTLCWNRNIRRIGLGNVMSSSRHGKAYGAERKSRAERLLRKMNLGGGRSSGRKKDAIGDEGVGLMTMNHSELEYDSSEEEERVLPQSANARKRVQNDYRKRD